LLPLRFVYVSLNPAQREENGGQAACRAVVKVLRDPAPLAFLGLKDAAERLAFRLGVSLGLTQPCQRLCAGTLAREPTRRTNRDRCERCEHRKQLLVITSERFAVVSVGREQHSGRLVRYEDWLRDDVVTV
jgi:hypothetical protein